MIRPAAAVLSAALLAAAISGVRAEDPPSRSQDLPDHFLRTTLPANECWRFGKAGEVSSDSLAVLKRYDSAKPDEKADQPLCRIAIKAFEWDKNYSFGPGKLTAKGDEPKALAEKYYIALFAESFENPKKYKTFEKVKYKKIDKVNGFEVYGMGGDYKIPVYLKCLFFKGKKHTFLVMIQCYKDSEKTLVKELQEVCDGLEIVKKK